MLKLAIPFLLLMNLGEPRVPGETNQAPDVVLRDSETAPVAAKPQAVAEPAKPIDLEASAAAARIRSLNAKVFEAKIAITQANGQVDALKSRLDKSQDEVDKIWTDRLDLDIKLASVRAQRDNALAEIKRLTEEKDRDARRYEDLSAWNRKLYAMHFLIILLIPLVVFLYFAQRRQVAGIYARLPDEDTSEIVQDLRDKLEKNRKDHSETRAIRDDLLMKRNTLSKMFDEEHAERVVLNDQNATMRQTAEALAAELEDKTGMIDAQQNDIQRLVALQQRSEATITGLQRELAEALELLETMPTPAPLHTDPAVIAEASATIDKLEASRAAMHAPVPEPVDPTEESTKPIEPKLPPSELPPTADERPPGK